LAGAPPQTPLGELTALPQTSYSWIRGGLLLREGRGGKREEEKGGGVRRREGRGGISGNVAEEAFCLKSAPGPHLVA